MVDIVIQKADDTRSRVLKTGLTQAQVDAYALDFTVYTVTNGVVASTGVGPTRALVVAKPDSFGAEGNYDFINYPGSPVGVLTPTRIGQRCFDTANKIVYTAVGTGISDWTQLKANPVVPSQGQFGQQIVDWGSAGTTGALGTTGTSSSFLRGSSVGYSVTVTAGGGRIRAGTVGSPLGITAVKGLGLWLYNPQSTTRALTVYLTNTADTYTNYSNAVIAVRPGVGYYTINRAAFDLGKTGSGFSWAQSLAQIQLTATVNGAGDTSAFQLGETVYVGGIFNNPRVADKAKFLIWSDDGKASNIVPSATAMIGGDGISRKHSIASFVASYGFTYSACIIYNLLGTGGYLTVDQMLALQSAGVMIGNHCWHFGTSSEVSGSTTGDGIRVLGPYGYGLSPVGPKVLSYGTVQNDASLIISEIQGCFDRLAALGITTAGHFVLPEGGFDQYVCSALDSMGCIRSVRSIGTSRESIPWAQYGFKNNAANGQSWRSKKPFYAGGIQLDVSTSADTASIQAYVDEVELSGGVGCAFIHDFNHTDLGGGLFSDQALADLCNYLATKASTIDVVTPETLYQQLPPIQVDL